MSPTGADLSKLDADAVRATQRLISRGFEAYLVGGCVRDLLLGRAPKDYDIATEARPPQVKRTFPRNSRIIGRRFKLAHLHFNNNTKILEVSTFRRSPPESGAVGADGGDADLLITRDNEFGNAEEDALRRDFTVNALFLDPTRDLILDYANGLADVRDRVIRTIGDPRVRFREDPVRILRAAKFAGRLGFTIEPETFAAMAETSCDLVRSAPPRLLEEILRLLRGGHALDSFQLLRDVGALKCLVPVLAEFLATARHDQRVAFWGLLDALDHRILDTGYVPQNAVLLGVLLVCPVLAKAEANPGRSPSSIAEELLGPLSLSLRLPRRDAGCLKRICGVQHRFLQADDTKRFRIAGFVQGPYFEEAFELFDLRMMASGEGAEAMQRWQEIAGSMGHHAPADGDFGAGNAEEAGPIEHEHDEERGEFLDETGSQTSGQTTDSEAAEQDSSRHRRFSRRAAGSDDVQTGNRSAPDSTDEAEPNEPDPREPDEMAFGSLLAKPSVEADATTDEARPDDGTSRRRRRRRRGRGRGDAGGRPPAESERPLDGDVSASSQPSAEPAARVEAEGRRAQSPRRPLRADFIHPEGYVPPEGPADDSGDRPQTSPFLDDESGAPDAEPASSQSQADSQQQGDGDAGRRRRRRRRRGRGNRDAESQGRDDRFPRSDAPAPHGEAVDAHSGRHEPLAIEPAHLDPDAPLPEALPEGADADAGPEVDPDDGGEVAIPDGTAAPTTDHGGDGERRGRRRRRRGRRGRGRDDQPEGETLEVQGPPLPGEVDQPAVDGAEAQPAEAAAAELPTDRRQQQRPQHRQQQDRQQQGRGQGQGRSSRHPQPQDRQQGSRHQHQGRQGQRQPDGRQQGQQPQGQQQQQQARHERRPDRPDRSERQDRRDKRRGGRNGGGGGGQGAPRDVDVVPRYRDRRGKVDVIEPAALDLSAFDVELDPKRVPTFGSIVEGKGRPKKRTPRVPEDGVDDYRPPPPPGSDSGPSAPPPPPPSDAPDTFGDW